MWFIVVNWNQAAVLRGSECSHVEDSSDAHRDYSSPLTHRPRNGTDVDRSTEREGGGIPQKENSGYKNSIVLSSNPPAVTSLP